MENELEAEQEEDADHFFSDLMPIVVSKTHPQAIIIFYVVLFELCFRCGALVC